MAQKNENIVKIHGKDYMTVAGRLELAHKASRKKMSIVTELLPVMEQVVIKATVVTEKGTFTGISAANPMKMIERMSPYEVAETSAVGRALGFAGFGTDSTIATADEMVKAQNQHEDDDSLCTCGTTGKYHALGCPARKQQEAKSQESAKSPPVTTQRNPGAIH
ncbi:MAG: hypothetical protein RI947_986 [Candidatus Parcubacteria bacterium]|jgi:hypothetical protein